MNLTSPSQKDGQHLLVETRPDKLEDWLESLPYGNMERAIAEVSRAVASLNRIDIKAQQREELVGLFDRTYEQISSSYRPYPQQITNKELYKKELAGLHQLTSEMAFAHKILVNHYSEKRGLWKKTKHLIRQMNFALHYLGISLAEHYETYTSIPIFLWKECNDIYDYAQEQHFENQAMESSTLCLPTIEQTYARICLLALCDPYQLSSSEHWHIFDYLKHWSQVIEFTDDLNEYTPSCCFALHLKSQEKPSHDIETFHSLSNDKLRLMLTGNIVKQIQYQLGVLHQERKVAEATFSSQMNLQLVENLLNHMHQHWDSRTQRKSQRYPILTQIDTVWGLENICTLLSQHQTLKSSCSWDEQQTYAFLSEHSSSRIMPLGWEAINAGLDGICINNTDDVADDIYVGDIVLIREYVDNQPSHIWKAAICRWLFSENESCTRVGLEFIHGELIPGRLAGKLSKMKQSNGQPALLLKANSNDKKSEPYIIASRGSYQVDRSFIFTYGQCEDNIRVRNRSFVTNSIEQFSFQIYDHVDLNNDNNELNLDIPWTSQSHNIEDE